MHRQDRACHWCGVQSQPIWKSAKLWSTAAGLLVMSGASVAAWTYRAPIRDTAQLIIARAFAPGARTESRLLTEAVTQTASAPSTSSSGDVGTIASTAPDSSQLADSALMAVALNPVGMIASVEDSIQWTPAVARTWVNVRNDASRGGNVVGVINPSSRAMLGTTRAGWRLVKSTDVTGWADPRLFEPDSNRTRGL